MQGSGLENSLGFTKAGPSIRAVVMVAIVGLQILAAAIFISFYHHTSRQAVLDQSRQLMMHDAELATRHIEGFLKPFEATLRVSAALLQNGVLGDGESGIIERYLREQLSASPEISRLFYARSNGDLIMAGRSTGIEPKSLSHASQPWYRAAIEANDVVWTPSHLADTSGKRGMTVAVPVGHKDGSASGVVGIDLNITALSGVLTNLGQGENGAAFLMTASGEMIASSAHMLEGRAENASALRPAFTRAFDTFVIGRAGSDSSQFARIEAGGTAYDAVFTPVEIGGLHWTLGAYTPEADIFGQTITNRVWTVALAIPLLLLAVLIGWAVSNVIIRPAKLLPTVADRISNDEKAEVAGIPKGFSEVQDAPVALNRLTRGSTAYCSRTSEQSQWPQGHQAPVAEETEALKAANAALQLEIATRIEAERGLEIEISKHRETAEEFRSALRQAHRASRSKSLFMSGMSHELRTPLNAILGFSQMLEGQAGTISEEKQAEYVGYILWSGERLLDLINEVLDLAQVEAGQALLTIEAVDPRMVIGKVIVETGILAKNADIDLIDETTNLVLPTISADARRMMQCLVNVVANAIKYNRTGGNVRISATSGPQMLRIAVTDTGIGIPEQRQEEVFETFNRLGAEGTDIEGSGIGLSLTKEFIEKMGGEIGFDSVEGQGSTFWFDLPLRQSTAQDDDEKPQHKAQEREIA